MYVYLYVCMYLFAIVENRQNLQCYLMKCRALSVVPFIIKATKGVHSRKTPKT